MRGAWTRALVSLCLFTACSCIAILWLGDTGKASSAAIPAAARANDVACFQATPGEYTAHSQVQPPQPTAVLSGALRCNTYLELKWGSGPGELGLCPSSSEQWWRGPYPLQVDAHSNLFVVDKVNGRISKYGADGLLSAFTIPRSYQADDPCRYGRSIPSNLAIGPDRLFLLFPGPHEGRTVDRIGVLSVGGQVKHEIDLEPYYPLHSGYLEPIVADREGGVYLLLDPVGIIHFDSDFRPEFKFLPTQARGSDGNFVVGWDSNVYIYDPEDDTLRNYGPSDQRPMIQGALSWVKSAIGASGIVSPTGSSILGVDTKGRAYFRTIGQDNVWSLLRVDPSGKPIVAGDIPEDDALVLSGLAPEGTLYGLRYDYRDPDHSVAPTIIRCTLEPE